jgi:hypothetical protein
VNFGEGQTMLRADLLLTVSEELSDLGAAALSVQATLGGILQSAAVAGQAGFWHLQEIDRLHQTLDDLAAILRVAAEDEGPRVDVERLAGIARLGSLRERLRGSGSDREAGQDAGIVAIF